MTNTIIEMVKGTEITLLTKKTRKETKIFVSDIWDNGKIIVGWYTNKFGEISVKQFDMTKYDFCI